MAIRIMRAQYSEKPLDFWIARSRASLVSSRVTASAASLTGFGAALAGSPPAGPRAAAPDRLPADPHAAAPDSLSFSLRCGMPVAPYGAFAFGGFPSFSLRADDAVFRIALRTNLPSASRAASSSRSCAPCESCAPCSSRAPCAPCTSRAPCASCSAWRPCILFMAWLKKLALLSVPGWPGMRVSFRFYLHLVHSVAILLMDIGQDRPGDVVGKHAFRLDFAGQPRQRLVARVFAAVCACVKSLALRAFQRLA